MLNNKWDTRKQVEEYAGDVLLQLFQNQNNCFQDTWKFPLAGSPHWPVGGVLQVEIRRPLNGDLSTQI